MNRSWLAGIFLTLATGAATGCSAPARPGATLGGQITLDGRPLTEGVIRFADGSQGANASAPLGADGRFLVAKPIPNGTYVVYWTLPFVNPGAPPPPTPKGKVPQKHISELTSTLRVEVKAGPNDLTLELE